MAVDGSHRGLVSVVGVIPAEPVSRVEEVVGVFISTVSLGSSKKFIIISHAYSSSIF